MVGQLVTCGEVCEQLVVFNANISLNGEVDYKVSMYRKTSTYLEPLIQFYAYTIILIRTQDSDCTLLLLLLLIYSSLTFKLIYYFDKDIIATD